MCRAATRSAASRALKSANADGVNRVARCCVQLDCVTITIVGIGFNAHFLVVTTVQRVEGLDDILALMANISVAYLLLSACIRAVAARIGDV